MDTEPRTSASPQNPRPTGTDGQEVERGSVAERGYVIALTALMLIPMLVFTAFATDVGAWYVRAQEIQRAADAAALAAVVWMPDTTKAREVAIEVAARNGFVDEDLEYGDTDAKLPQVWVSKVGSQRVRVDIVAEGDLYFGSVIESFEEPEIHRFATAEYVLPVPMGNPTSALGTGGETTYGEPDNFYLNSNGRCRRRRDGDVVTGEHSFGCKDRPFNTGEYNSTALYDALGHAFIVDVPEDPVAAAAGNPGRPGGNFVLQARVSCYRHGGTDPTMRFTLYEPDDTPLDDYDNEVLSGRITNPPIEVTHGPCPSGYVKATDGGTWNTIASLPDSGRYVLRSFNLSGENEVDDGYSYQAYYSLRVHNADLPANANWGCSRIDNSSLATWDLCPNLSAREWMTVVTEKNMLPNPTQSEAELYLAEIGEQHRGKTLEITLFDAADGLDFIQIVGPDNVAYPVVWSAIDNSDFGYGLIGNDIGTITDSGPWGPQYCLGEPCVTNPEPSIWSYMQDRTIRMQIELPASYSCVDDGSNPEDCWWKVRYVDGVIGEADIGEVTSWSVRVIGDPVRLIE